MRRSVTKVQLLPVLLEDDEHESSSVSRFCAGPSPRGLHSVGCELVDA